MTTPNPSRRRFGRGRRRALSRAAGRPVEPVGQRPAAAGGPDIPQAVRGSGVLIVVLIAAIGVFLLWRAVPALARNQVNFFTYGGNWDTTNTSAMRFGVLESVPGDRVRVAVRPGSGDAGRPGRRHLPHAVRAAAGRGARWPTWSICSPRCRRSSTACGGCTCSRRSCDPSRPGSTRRSAGAVLFATGNASVAGGGTIFTAGIVLAVMILPIITAVTREVFMQTPQRPDRGGAGAGRHPLGGRQDDRAAVRAVRLHQRRDAGPGPRAG